MADVLRSMEGKVYAITGGGGGIGRATAIRAAQLGAAGLALCDVNIEALETTKKTMYGRSPNHQDSRKPDQSVPNCPMCEFYSTQSTSRSKTKSATGLMPSLPSLVASMVPQTWSASTEGLCSRTPETL